MTMTSQIQNSAERRMFSFRVPHSAFRVRLGWWFLVQIKEIVDFEEELAFVKN